MTDFQLSTPVAFIIFNRPDTTARVFAEIARAKPPRLLIVADGPRPDRAGETEKCTAVRKIVEQVDWNCEVLTHYSETNLGCRKRVSSGLDWVFEIVEQAIILEDDCLPHPAFFQFCEELLNKYHDDERIMMVSGDNFQFARRRTDYSYYFSYYVHIWGWASWRRAWQHYDVNMSIWPIVRDGMWLTDLWGESRAADFWSKSFESMYNNYADTWDTQWFLACWIQNGLSVVPNSNLVSNIGFGPEAIRTKNPNNFLANLPVEGVTFPLRHPPFMIRDSQADKFTFTNIIKPDLNSLLRRAVARLKKRLNP